MDKVQIKEYIREFSDKLNDMSVPDIQIVDDPTIGDKFRELGFVMDAGESFKQKYGGKAFNKYEILESIISSVDCIDILGSAIYSKWRYYNHWASSSIREVESMRWFNVALKRMIELTDC